METNSKITSKTNSTVEDEVQSCHVHGTEHWYINLDIFLQTD